MGDFEKQVKERAQGLKRILNKGFKVVKHACKNGWEKVKHIRKR
jgi:hypothetical protein|uniref:Uncharacterized protein n=1 Tax=Picea sitchensis TaxID=3332 RepID=A9NJU0_PICSI|nr:unknown [Picea sitchensis]